MMHLTIIYYIYIFTAILNNLDGQLRVSKKYSDFVQTSFRI